MDASSEAPDTAAIPWDTLHSSIWRAVLQQLPPRQRCQAAVVCSSWRRHALSLCSQHLTLSLHSSRSCGALGLWLRRHGHTLTSLDITDSYYTHERVQGASRIRPVDRLALLQGLHGGGRPLASLTSLRLRLNELSPADAAVLGLCACPCLTSLQLDSNGSSIGVAGAQGLAPLSQLQALLAPAQSLGDEGLRIICVSMPRLATINLHNDGHVTDDGLPYLARLRHLTSLDLQGSISITNRGMSSLAQCVPQLQELNISWCAGVDDYGLGQLCSLTALTALNLAATGISFTDATVLQALSQLSALARLRLDRLAVGEPQLEALAAALPGLQDLSLAYNSRLASFASLRALSGLSQLTRLDYADSQVNKLEITSEKQYIAAAGNSQVRLFEVNSNDPQPVSSYEGHQGNVTAVGFQKDSKWMYTGGEDGTVRVWDLRSPGCQREYGSRAAVNTVVLHPNQGELISGDQTGHIRVWDLTANACSCELVPEVGTAVRSLTVALDGSMVVAANNHGTCYVWRMLRGTSLTTHFEPLHKLRAHSGYILKCLISPDVQQLATTSSDKSVKLWNLDGFSLERTLTGHTRWVWDCVFSVDAAYLVTASSDATARLWDLSTGEAIRTYSGHHKAITCCALNDSAIDGRDADS
ncbi:hypothetical protein OEZ85_006153 [Tetradesmus obliquus]|uniref:Leucine-rich repeat and WD repeat-containing protein 1 n=1 Tax=Tetradesmus obliquus TaxID=3088 RepID=A0ABY8UFQ1_TETOB|nr:hypothetical protein OEZ85_006153 [Tetradesmus obliquus]